MELSRDLDEILEEVPEDEVQTVKDNLARATASDLEALLYEVPLRRRSGEIAWLEVNSHPIEYKGETVELAFLRDITERKRAEKARKQLLNDVADRVQGLDFLHKVTKLVSAPDKPMEEILQEGD